MVFLWIVLAFLAVGLLIALCGGLFVIILKVLVGLGSLLISIATTAFFPLLLIIGFISVVKKVLKD
nr:MAG TPA: hypothetical protein [Caudoviricetes sp.]